MTFQYWIQWHLLFFNVGTINIHQTVIIFYENTNAMYLHIGTKLNFF